MKNLFISVGLLCSSVILWGCSDPEPQPTITQGVYGVLIAGCDTSGCDSERIEGQAVHLLTESPDPMTGMAGTPIASNTTDDIGMYEIKIDPGDYFLYMHANVGWTNVTIPSGLIRCDWISGPGGGNWQCGGP